MSKLDGYFLYGVDGEMLLVIRGRDEEQMLNVINKLQKARDKEIKELGRVLEEHFVERQDNGGSASKTESKDS